VSSSFLKVVVVLFHKCLSTNVHLQCHDQCFHHKVDVVASAAAVLVASAAVASAAVASVAAVLVVSAAVASAAAVLVVSAAVASAAAVLVVSAAVASAAAVLVAMVVAFHLADSVASAVRHPWVAVLLLMVALVLVAASVLHNSEVEVSQWV